MAESGAGGGAAMQVPLRRLEPALNKFTRVAIPTDLERLARHQVNIEKYNSQQDWKLLHQEQINASRTVQQLQFNVREMEKLRLLLRTADGAAFEHIVQPARDLASSAIAAFLRHPATSCHRVRPSMVSTELLVRDDAASGPTEGAGEQAGPPSTPPSSPQLQDQLLALHEIPQEEDASESWEHLCEELTELNSLVTDFSYMVHSQQEAIDSIEDKLEMASDNVRQGTKQIGKAAKSGTVMLPVAGAVLGGILGGPVGMLVGFKVAGVAAALGGGLLGFTGARAFQRHRRARVDTQLQQLSSSCPEL
uniref:Syntaxin 17 n=1 Tax=Petromyzon marinus TaxID=7757 RepID=S4RLC4_PETMA